MLALLFLSLLLPLAASCSVSGATLPDGVFTGMDGFGYAYEFSFCEPLPSSACGSDICVCQSLGDSDLSCGAFNTRTVTAGGNFASVSFSNGTQCANGHHRSTRIDGSCDASVFGLVVDSITEPSMCEYVITVRSNSFCSSVPSCTYGAGTNQYDLSKVPVLSKVDPDFEYVLSLCNNGSNVQNCANGTSLVCQKVLRDNMEFSLGSTQSVTSASTYSVDLEFQSGSKCANGQNRRSVVHALCAQENKIINVTEAPLCVYTFFVATQAACPTVPNRKALLRKK